MKGAGDTEHFAATEPQSSEPYPHEMRDLLQYQRQYAKEHYGSWIKTSLAIGAVVAGTTLITAPVAKELAIEQASIDTDVAEAPAEMRFTGNGTSSLQTGIFGTYNAPVHKGDIGITAEMKDIPGGSSTNVRDLFSPQYVNVLTSFYHDPKRSVDVYADLLKSDAQSKGDLFLGMGMLGFSALALGPLALRKDWREGLNQYQKTTAAVGVGLFAVSFAISNGVASDLHASWAKDSPSPENAYPIKGLEGTFLEGTTASNQPLQLATNEAVPFFKKNRDRQEAATNEFVEHASQSILLQTGKMIGPRDGETVSISLADIHSSQAMSQVLKILHDTWSQVWPTGVIKDITISGDETTNGAAPEGVFIQDIAEIGKGPDEDSDEDDTPEVAVSGDHETAVSVGQMVDAGQINPDMGVETVNGTTFLGANDTAQKDVGGSKTNEPIGGITEHELGQQVREIADKENPDVTLLHQGYAAASFLDIEKQYSITNATSMHTFLMKNGPHDVYLTRYRDDGIPNVPTKLLQYGHWHSEVPAHTIWNEEWVSSDTAVITWTMVSELNTAGGAIGNPTVNKFSLPWYPPLQDAGVRLTFKDAETGMVTGYRDYTFDTSGKLTISPRVDVGLPGGKPGIAHFTRSSDGTLKLKRVVLADDLPADLRQVPASQN